MSTLHQIHDRELLHAIAGVNLGFHAPAAVLEGLTGEQATMRPPGAPHSIAEITAHICYWQDFFNRIALEGFTGAPAHAAEGWPPCEAEEWPALRDRFLAVVAQSRQIARKCSGLDQKLLPEGLEIPFLNHDTRGTGVLHGAIHSAHHLGQIVLLRQIMGLWPPPAGPLTW